MFSESEQRLINTRYGGDAQAYIADHIHSRKKVLQWNDIVASETVFPAYTLTAHHFIERWLGYLPEAHVTLPYESFLRTIIYHYRGGSMTVDDLIEQAKEYIQLIRNKHMQEHTQPSYSRENYQRYFDYLPQYKEIVRERFARFLGYEPQLEHSLMAELLMRESMIHEDFHYLDDTPSPADMRSLTIIKYREVLFEQGKQEADNSPLITGFLPHLLENQDSSST